MPTFLTTGNPIIVGTTDAIRANKSVLACKKRNKAGVISLGVIKPEVVEVVAQLQVYNYGVSLQAGEFSYKSADGFLEIKNLDSIICIEPDESDSYAIPIVRLNDIDRSIGTIHTKPTGV